MVEPDHSYSIHILNCSIPQHIDSSKKVKDDRRMLVLWMRTKGIESTMHGFPVAPRNATQYTPRIEKKCSGVLQRNTREGMMRFLSSSRMRGPIRHSKTGFPSPTETFGNYTPSHWKEMLRGIEKKYSGGMTEDGGGAPLALKNTSHLGQKDARDKRARGNDGILRNCSTGIMLQE